MERLRKEQRVLIGGNIGKNKVTPNKDAVKDYLICFDALFEYVDYFVVNVSSPNTPGLRELQDKKPLTDILKKLKRENTNLAKKYESPEKPILLKIAPDLTDAPVIGYYRYCKSFQDRWGNCHQYHHCRKGLKSHLTLAEEKGDKWETVGQTKYRGDSFSFGEKQKGISHYCVAAFILRRMPSKN